MIRARALSRTFGPTTAVDRLNLEVAKGEVFGLVGPDGAGKTTTLRLLCGLLDPTDGSREVAGFDVAKEPALVRDRIGYMAQRFGLYGDLTVDENMRFYADLFGISRRERESLAVRLLEMTRMTPFRKRPASKLSGGMKQKLALMCTLLHHPEVLFLDEPTNGVDPVSRRDFWQILHQLIQEGLTVFVATAYLDEAERCDRVGLLHRGRLIRCDTPAALRNSIDDDCYAIKNCDLREAAAWLHGMPEVTSVEPAGAALHVFVKSGSAPARPPGCSVERITPSLEDVFIALLRRETFQ